MEKALELAKLGQGKTFPNPLVGCVIVKNNRIIASGYHPYYGGNHAERNAILNTKEDLKEATLYVNLEPCSHFGKQPPCCNLIVQNNISKVYYGIKDTNPKVFGSGIEYLKSNNVEVHGGILKNESWDLNEDFLYYQVTGLPLVVAKWASSIDGRIFTFTKESQWISNEKSRQYTHSLRNANQAIMVGANTLKLDNPQLNVRHIQEGNNPIKIIVSSYGDINLSSKIFLENKNNGKIIIATTEKIPPETEKNLYSIGCKIIKTKSINNQVDLHTLLKKLGEMGIISVLVEGGATLLKNLIVQKLINKAYVFIAPMLIGGNNNTLINENIYAKLKETPKFIYKKSIQFDNDLCIEYLEENYYQWKEKQLCSQEL